MDRIKRLAETRVGFLNISLRDWLVYCVPGAIGAVLYAWAVIALTTFAGPQ